MNDIVKLFIHTMQGIFFFVVFVGHIELSKYLNAVSFSAVRKEIVDSDILTIRISYGKIMSLKSFVVPLVQ